MKELTTLVKLVAKTRDLLGYTTYVFKILEKEEINRLDSKYIMCTRFPNWEHKNIDLEEVGYLNFTELRAGIDEWFDGQKMVPYKYNNIQFLKFVNKPENKRYEYIMKD